MRRTAFSLVPLAIAFGLVLFLVGSRNSADVTTTRDVAFAVTQNASSQTPEVAVGGQPDREARRGQIDARRRQVARGGEIYSTRCMRCHNTGARTEPFPNVISPVITSHALTWHGSGRELWQYVSTYMPFDQPGTLTDSENYDVLAFLLDINGLLPPGVVLDAEVVERLQFDPVNATSKLTAHQRGVSHPSLP